MATGRHVKVVHSPLLKGEETLVANSEQWNRQHKKRRRRRKMAGMAQSDTCWSQLGVAGHIKHEVVLPQFVENVKHSIMNCDKQPALWDRL